jgi:hypothetical protein
MATKEEMEADIAANLHEIVRLRDMPDSEFIGVLQQRLAESKEEANALARDNLALINKLDENERIRMEASIRHSAQFAEAVSELKARAEKAEAALAVESKYNVELQFRNRSLEKGGGDTEWLDSRLRMIHKASRSVGIADTYFRTAAALLSDIDAEVSPFEWETKVLDAVKKHLLKTPSFDQEDLLDFLRSILVLGDGVTETTTQLHQVTWQLNAARKELEETKAKLTLISNENEELAQLWRGEQKQTIECSRILHHTEEALRTARGTIDDMTEHQVVLNDEIERLKDQPHEDPRRTEYVVGLEKTIDDIEKELEKTGNEPLKSEEPYATVQLGRWALVDEIHAIINHRKEKKDDKDDKEEREGTDR